MKSSMSEFALRIAVKIAMPEGAMVLRPVAVVEEATSRSVPVLPAIVMIAPAVVDELKTAKLRHEPDFVPKGKVVEAGKVMVVIS